MSKAVTEQELAEKVVAPRATRADIDALLDRTDVHTTTCMTPTPHVMAIAWLDGKFHLGTAISKADITTGHFDEDFGINRSTHDVLKIAENKLWELEGYRLFTTPTQPKNHIERMKLEKAELDSKLNGLNKFLSTLGGENSPLLTDDQVDLLKAQQQVMTEYTNILASRIHYDTHLFDAVGSLEAKQ